MKIHIGIMLFLDSLALAMLSGIVMSSTSGSLKVIAFLSLLLILLTLLVVIQEKSK